MKYTQGINREQEWRDFCPGKTVQEIAEHFNITVGSAASQLSYYGLKTKHKSDIKYEGLKDYAKNHTAKESAEHFNVTYAAIKKYASNHNIVFKPTLTLNGIEKAVSKRTGNAQEMMITLCDFYSFGSVAKVFGYSKERVRQIYNEAKGEIK